MTQTQPIKYTVSPEQARDLLTEAYSLDLSKPVDKTKYSAIELEEIDELLSIINKQ
jgi:hypothetical protein